MIPRKRSRKTSRRAETLSAAEKRAIVDCASKLRDIGDKMDLQQKVLQALVKLLRPGT